MRLTNREHRSNARPMEVHSPNRLKSSRLGSPNGFGAFMDDAKVYAVHATVEEILEGVIHHSTQ